MSTRPWVSLGVHEQVTLSALDLLGPVVTAFLSAHARGLDRLAIHYSGTGLRVPLQANPHPFT
jgi:hypothetical protein